MKIKEFLRQSRNITIPLYHTKGGVNRVKVIGLTGNIGSGKTFIAERLQELGADVIDADQIARDVVKPNSFGLKEIINQFGSNLLTPAGELDRQKMGNLIFNNPTARTKLEAILHPLIEKEIKSQIQQYKKNNATLALIIEVPLLIETGMNHLVDEIWLVTIDPDIQIKRLQARNNLTLEQAMARIKAQMPQGQKIPYATKIIDNSYTPEKTKAQVDALWHTFIHKNEDTSLLP